MNWACCCYRGCSKLWAYSLIRVHTSRLDFFFFLNLKFTFINYSSYYILHLKFSEFMVTKDDK